MDLTRTGADAPAQEHWAGRPVPAGADRIVPAEPRPRAPVHRAAAPALPERTAEPTGPVASPAPAEQDPLPLDAPQAA